MTLFAFIPFFIRAIVETSRFILHTAQVIRISDLSSSGQSLKPITLLRKITASLIFLVLFPSG